METLAADLRFAARTLVRSPGFTLVALSTLALGVGATTSLFSVVDAVLLAPLPFPEPERLMVVQESNPERGFPRFSASAPNYADFRDRNRTFAGMSSHVAAAFHLTGDGDPERLGGREVTHEYLAVLGIRPRLGRGFVAEDDLPGAPPVAIVSERLFERRFGGDLGLVGRTILLGGEPTEVVGVIPTDDVWTGDDVLVPLRLDFAAAARDDHGLSIYGRLAPGVTLDEARADLSAIAGALAAEHAETNAGCGAVVDPLHARIVERVRPALLVLLAAVAALLAIACANVACLFLSRLAARRRELALRRALGAGRARVARGLLVEGLLLALGGGALGIALAAALTGGLVRLAGNLPRAGSVELDGRFLAFAFATSLATGLLFGWAPALRAARLDLASAVRGGRDLGRDRRDGTLRGGLVLAEVALAVTLLVGAGLLLTSLGRLLRVDPGFQPDGALTARLDLPGAAYGDEARQRAFFRALLPRLVALPGVESAGTVFPMPLTGGRFLLTARVDGSRVPPGEEPFAQVRIASPGYFAAMGIPARRGRTFDDGDDADAAPVVVISETAARRLFADEDPLGRRLDLVEETGAAPRWLSVVGVVGDVRHSDLAEAPAPEVYLPLFQRPFDVATLVVRAAGGDPTLLSGPLRAELAAVDPLLPLSSVQPLRALVERSLARSRFGAVLLAAFAGLALLLAATGLYGVVALAVERQRREIAVRRALGASTRTVLSLVVRQALAPVAGGAALGLVGAAWATRLLGDLLFETSAADPRVYAAVPAVLTLVAVAACTVPSLRASRVDPAVALRDE